MFGSFFRRPAPRICKEDELPEGEEHFGLQDLDDDVTFFHYGGLEGLPSFDPECLKIHMLLEMCGTRFKDEVSKEGLMSPSGDLPLIMSSKGRCIAGADLDSLLIKIIEEQTGHSLSQSNEYNEDLHRKVKDWVRPLWMSAVWSDPAIFNYILKPLYSAPYCFPIRELLIWKRQRALTGVKIDEASLSAFNEALKAVSDVLGDGRFFGGDSGLGLMDAVIGPDLMLIPFYLPASHQLHQMFSHYHNLYDYAIHMLDHLRHITLSDFAGK